MRLIDADKMNPRSICPAREDDSAYDTLCDFIAEQPTVDAEPVVHAHWEPYPYLDDMQTFYCKCSKCGRVVGASYGTDIHKDYPYCHCGAKMDEVINDEN